MISGSLPNAAVSVDHDGLELKLGEIEKVALVKITKNDPFVDQLE